MRDLFLFKIKKIICICGFLFSLSAECNLPGESIDYGKGTYGQAHVIGFGEGARVSVGKYCSIASGVVIMTGGEHRVDWVTTYPFSVFLPQIAGHIKGHPKTKGNVIIGNDVWVGMDAFILSGVTIGDGAVIGAKSVVTKNVPPYAIVGGNPAKVIRYRFEQDIINRLVALAWWDWPEEKIKSMVSLLLSSDVETFLKMNE